MIELGLTMNGIEAIEKAEMLKSPRKNGRGLFHNRPQVVIQCFCGNKKTVRWDAFKKGRIKSCGCLPHPGNKLGKFTRRYGKDSPHWKGHGDISAYFWNHILHGAKNRGIEVSITIQDAWDLFIEQNKCCSLTGEPLTFGITVKEHRSGMTTASLDRIDSKKGYLKDNVQWVHKTINLLKMQLPQEEFIEWCFKVCKYKN